jgi:hypothetical protein
MGHPEKLLPAEKFIGAPGKVEVREIINALMYVADNGIKWRAMRMIFLLGNGLC